MKLLRAVMVFLLLIISVGSAEEKRFTIPVGESPQKGLKDAPVTIVEFIDFQ
ncbi:MAG: hypothetical protein HZB62_05745 [Nitrospirae bacterium]|nr:hypothetical protein [Nitrospirota bacterium]